MPDDTKPEIPEPECEHAFRGMDTSARIATPCPACGRSSLFIGKGGWLTCSRTACRAPGAINDAAQDVAAAEARGRAQGQREGRQEIISIIRETVFPACKCSKHPSCGADSELQTLFERVGLSEKS